MADHEHGSMDTSVQEKTFAGFMTMVTRSTIAILVALVFLALINCKSRADPPSQNPPLQ